MKTFLCFDGGGTYVKYAVMTVEGEVLCRSKYETPRDDLNVFLSKIREIYEAYPDVSGIALSMPGIIDIDKGYMRNAGAIRCCAGTCLCDMISEQCGGLPVSVENDGKAAARAEMVSGALKDADTGVVILLGTGIGGTVFVNRKIIRGNHLWAGELSYHYLRNQQLFGEEHIKDHDVFDSRYSSVCTPAGIVRRYAELSGETGLKRTDCELVFERMNQGDENARLAVRDAARDLAMMIFNIQCTIDPDAFAIGGGISEQDSYIDMLKEAVKAYVPSDQPLCPEPVIRVCRYRSDANLIGALYRFYEQYGQQGSLVLGG
ncbi:MAG: ROK family protein [Solobacterium sp.]|nr:ROK family protein [Solobacterium sp.]